MSNVVKYTDEEGWDWAVAIPEGLDEDWYKTAPIVGPPDLSELGLDKKMLKAIQNGLMAYDIYDGQTIMGRRKQIRDLMQELGLPIEFERQITVIFTRTYFD